jgi:hypothetical protein
VPNPYVPDDILAQLGAVPQFGAMPAAPQLQPQANAFVPPDVLAQLGGVAQPQAFAPPGMPDTQPQAPAQPLVQQAPVQTPRGMVKTGETVRPALDVSGALAAEDKSTNERAAATAELGTVRNDAFQREVAAQEGINAAGHQNAVIQAEQQREIQRAALEERGKLLSEKDAPVEQNKYFKDIGVGGAIATILAASVTGALQAVANNKSQAAGQAAPFDLNQNPVVGAVSTAVARSIALQREARAEKREDRARGLVWAESQFKDAQQQERALNADAFEFAARLSEANAKKHQGTVIEAAALKDAADLRAESVRYKNELSTAAAEQRQLQFSRPAPPATASATNMLKELEAQREVNSLVTTGRKFSENEALAKEGRDREQKQVDAETMPATERKKWEAVEVGLKEYAEALGAKPDANTGLFSEDIPTSSYVAHVARQQIDNTGGLPLGGFIPGAALRGAAAASGVGGDSAAKQRAVMSAIIRAETGASVQPNEIHGNEVGVNTRLLGSSPADTIKRINAEMALIREKLDTTRRPDPTPKLGDVAPGFKP